MFKKKNVVEFSGLPVVLSLRQAYNKFTGEITQKFLSYYDTEGKPRGLVGYEEFRDRVDLLNEKIGLILNHLELEYRPPVEETKKEGAKLVKKLPSLLGDCMPGQCVKMNTNSAITMGSLVAMSFDGSGEDKPIPKKRARKPKKG